MRAVHNGFDSLAVSRFRGGVLLDEMSAPANPGGGQVVMWAGADGRLRSKDSAGVETSYASTGDVVTVLPFSITGDVEAGTGTFRLYNDSGRAWTIRAVRATVGTPPTGTALTVDVLKNGVTIFGTPADRPTVPVGENTARSTGMTVTTVADGEYLTVDVVAASGADLVVQVTVS